jgi:nicotinamidase-related amidase
MLSAPIPVEPWDPDRIALLLMDFQKFTCSREHGLGKLAQVKGITPELDEYFSQVDAAIENSSRLLQACRGFGIEVIFTFLHQEPGNQELSRQFVVSQLPVPAGSLEDEYLGMVKPAEGESVFPRTTYSPFTSTNLLDLLEAKGKDTLFVAGMLFNYSVAMTVREAADRGMNVVAVWDASASETLDWHLVTRTGLVGGLILSRSTNNVIEMLEGKRT